MRRISLFGSIFLLLVAVGALGLLHARHRLGAHSGAAANPERVDVTRSIISKTFLRPGVAGVRHALPESPTVVWTGGSDHVIPDLSGNGNDLVVRSGAAVDSAGITFSAAGQQVETRVSGTYQTALVCFTHNTGPAYATNPVLDESQIFEANPVFLGTTVQEGSTWLGGNDELQYSPGASKKIAAWGVAYVYPSVVRPTGGYSAAVASAWIGGPHCLIHVRGAAHDTFYMDGELQPSWYNSGSARFSMLGNTVLGGIPASPTHWFWGTFHTVILWPTALSMSEMRRAERWASADLKGRALRAPGEFPPMKSDRISRFAISTMSIGACAGVDPDHCWNTHLKLANRQLNDHIVRCALGGVTQSFLTARAPYCEDAEMAANAPENIALLWDGINAGGRAGLTPAQNWAEAVRWSNDKHRRGIRTIIGTMICTTQVIPFGGGLSAAQYQAAYNRLVYAHAQQYFDGVADFSGDTVHGGAAHLGCAGCGANPAYFIDGTHPGDAAQPIIADIVQDAVDRLTRMH